MFDKLKNKYLKKKFSDFSTVHIHKYFLKLKLKYK
jgi:hypothetical protein